MNEQHADNYSTRNTRLRVFRRERRRHRVKMFTTKTDAIFGAFFSPIYDEEPKKIITELLLDNHRCVLSIADRLYQLLDKYIQEAVSKKYIKLGFACVDQKVLNIMRMCKCVIVYSLLPLENLSLIRGY